MTKYCYAGTHKDAVHYAPSADGKARLTAHVRGTTFGGDTLTAVETPDGSVRVKLPLPASVVEDDKNWVGGVFSLPASALQVTVVASAPEECYGKLRESLFRFGRTVAAFGIYKEGDKEECLTISIAPEQAGKEFWVEEK